MALAHEEAVLDSQKITVETKVGEWKEGESGGMRESGGSFGTAAVPDS